jgi:hypothetical protein
MRLHPGISVGRLAQNLPLSKKIFRLFLFFPLDLCTKCKSRVGRTARSSDLGTYPSTISQVIDLIEI